MKVQQDILFLGAGSIAPPSCTPSPLTWQRVPISRLAPSLAAMLVGDGNESDCYDREAWEGYQVQGNEWFFVHTQEWNGAMSE